MSWSGLLILAIAVGFLVYIFTGSSRLVAGTLFLGLLALLAVGFFSASHDSVAPRRLVDLGPQRQHVNRSELGPAAETSLLGVPAKGHHFVYVIDRSSSMGEGGHNSALTALKEPLTRSLTDLQRNHRFQVFLVGNGVGHCGSLGTDQLAVADNHNVVRTMEWIEACTADDGPENPERFPARDALYQALALQPDVIYFVTDGRGTRPGPTDLDSIRRWNTGRTTVHVIQLVVANSKTEKPPRWLQDLATYHRGKFHSTGVTARPAEKEPSAKPPPSSTASVAGSSSAKRPEWVANPPQSVQRSGQEVRRAVASSGFSKGEERARDNFDANLLKVAASYIDEVVERGAGQKLTQYAGVRERTLQYLSTNVVKDRYREEKRDPDEAIGEGVEQYALLEFNEQTAAHFRQEWRLIVQERRLLTLAAGVAVLLGVVGTVFAYLKTDTATRGYYSGWLRLAAGAAIFAIIAAAAAVFITDPNLR
jgi:hypothetical protein